MNPNINADADSALPQSGMGLQIIASCSGGGCPTIYRTAHGTLVVQGYAVTGQTGVHLPDGELLVEIPAELLAEAARAVG